VTETQDLIDQCRGHYASLLSMCDARLGDVLDEMDRLGMWEDTMLIVWTDHGFLLGEHDLWAKGMMPWYREHANTPFFVWDPRCGKRNERRSSLVQPSIDLGPTLLEFFDREPTSDMLGQPLKDTIADDKPVRDAAIFGTHGGQINVTDGRFVYMRAANPENQPLYNYTLMPTHMREMFSVDEFGGAELSEPFSFTKGCPLLRTRDAKPPAPQHDYGNLLFDQETDPWQSAPLQDEKTEQRLLESMRELMRTCEAPEEQYERMGL